MKKDIVIKDNGQIILPDFKENAEKFDFLMENKEKLIECKMVHGKQFVTYPENELFIDSEKSEEKADISSDATILNVKSVISTSGIFDSHFDVHIKGLFKKTVQEIKNRPLFLLKEHDMSFDGEISDEVKASLEMFKFRELGFKSDLETEALIFDSIVRKAKNLAMFERYRKHEVKNHSVRMVYVKIGLAINDDQRVAEFDLWNKHIDIVANMKEVEDVGFFWAITEAKIRREGSAVLLGSNFVTPTLEVSEPAEATPKSEEEAADESTSETLKGPWSKMIGK